MTIKKINYPLESVYHYKVVEHMTTFEKDVPQYYHEETFSEGDLLECRKQAIVYYMQQLQAIENKGSFFGKSFEAFSKEFKVGEHSAFSINLVFVECNPDLDDGEEWYIIYGDSDEVNADGQENEKHVYQELGINLYFNN